MTARIYLTAVDGRSGKSAVALGVVYSLLKQTPRVGIFRPLIRSGETKDRVLQLLIAAAHSDLSYEESIGVTYEAAHNDPEQALSEIVSRYKKLESKCDAVVIVGSDYTDIPAPTEFAFNAKIAANLDAPVLLVIGGRDASGLETLGQLPARTPRELASTVDSALTQLKEAHARHIATVINRADANTLDEIISTVQKEVPNSPVWAIPENELLVAPSVATVLNSIGGTLVRGDAELLDREIRGIVIAGMHMEHVLGRLTEGAVIVVPADRSETLLAVVMAHEATTFPTIAAVVMNGDFPLVPDVERLLDGIKSSLPIIRVNSGTFDTVQAIVRARGLLSETAQRKFDTVYELFTSHVDVDELQRLLAVDTSNVRTPLMFAYDLFERASATSSHIVLPEGNDDRVLRAASTALSRGIAQLTILGDETEVRRRAGELGLDLSKVAIINPENSDLVEEFAAEYARLRAHKGVTLETARERVTDVSYFGTMMVHMGLADGMVSGAAHTTAHTIKPSFEIIKTKPGTSVVSSVFFMALADRVLVYGDCAVNPDPTAAQLADIAISSADTAAQFGVEPRIAMLSYSTGESGYGADVDKVRAATKLAKERRPDLLIEGPIQYDAASDPATGAAKLPGSEVAGRATVFIFPDLNTGNNTYKAVQRSAAAIAVGPVLQGLNKPVNDLSRGATTVDIVNTIAITAVQAGLATTGNGETE
ncbi:phosphate acetyltransferase [Canibacter zhoujuaniae]|uniref:phosphate acetyltransferase n=1 Tax=Canibacter zhoujuaniae TaxID=2708343 RepID=UPI001423E20A|nr:phosphate acetyltransferase [Canibacter zhoujuaniae]